MGGALAYNSAGEMNPITAGDRLLRGLGSGSAVCKFGTCDGAEANIRRPELLTPLERERGREPSGGGGGVGCTRSPVFRLKLCE